MKKDKGFYWKLFYSTFLLSAFTFGGGYVIVSLMKKQFVDDYKWIDDEEMLDLVAIAQSSPGAIAVNGAIVIGYKLAGWFGIMVTTLATVLPPFIIISIISLFYAAFSENLWVSLMLDGMQAGVAAVIAAVVLEMGASVLKRKSLVLTSVMVLAFIANYFFSVNVMLIVLACIGIGLIYTFMNRGETA